MRKPVKMLCNFNSFDTLLLMASSCFSVRNISIIKTDKAFLIPQSKRHSSCETTAEFYESLLLMCGPKAVIHVSANLWGPDIDTVKEWKRKHAILFDFGKPFQNIKLVAEI